MINRYKAIVQYNGSQFSGWATQKGFRTIQETIEKTISKCLDTDIKIHASGRTDKYVHALGQVFHFDSDVEITDWMISNINNYFKNEIKITYLEKVSNKFHARFDVKKKTYLYKISTKQKDIFEAPICLQYAQKINLNKLRKVSKKFIGEHDFLSFSTTDKENTVRNIYEIKIYKKRKYVFIEITGNGFLRNMVRMIVGTLLNFNEGKISMEEIDKLLVNPKKGSSITKAEGCGLYLKQVQY